MGAPSFCTSFRRQIRDGVGNQQRTDLLSTLDPIKLSPSSDGWVCDLNGEGTFRVKDIRLVLNDMYLPVTSDATRWVKCVPIKVNNGILGFFRSGCRPYLNPYWRVCSSQLGG
nr:RNA-directed DNA polymerase, eukaryota [Tanacetum cinerariifolium]